MTKIIPWSLPTVAGGSIGGYTPQPTPEPATPDPDDPDQTIYLDFSDAVDESKLNVGASNFRTLTGTHRYSNLFNITVKLQAEPVTVVDISTISGIRVDYTVDESTLVYYDSTSAAEQTTLVIPEKVVTDESVMVNSSNWYTYGIFLSAGGYQSVTVYGDSYVGSGSARQVASSDYDFTLGDVTLDAVRFYDADGNVLQEWTK